WEKDPKGKYPDIHPTQKPVCMLKKLIRIFTDEGDVVIDPCCGSGTTLRAAKELDRPSYGFEIDRNFYERAKNEMLIENYGEIAMRSEDSVIGQRNIFDFPEVLP
ncbi:MAG: site-specific DNA-methyltransferase, partial [Lachnospiraceae bacterium]|nr:site-specific DNA-methyltransferase [Lachnospiraceae bacterium]